MLVTRAQMQEIDDVRAEVKAIVGAPAVEEAKKLIDEVQQMMWAVDSASYVMHQAQGVGSVLQDIRAKVAEVRTMQQLVKQLEEN